MATWSDSLLRYVYIGQNPNDGTGTAVRQSFEWVSDNFRAISQHLADPQLSFFNANIINSLNAAELLSTNVSIANLLVTTSNTTGNATAGNLISTTGLYSSGIANFNGVTNMGTINQLGPVNLSNNIIPTANLAYDLGSPTVWFNNAYIKNLFQTNVVTIVSEASILQLQDISNDQDVGILANLNATGNNYSYFGYDHLTGEFIHKSAIELDPTTRDYVVTGGVYGSARLGSLILSNTVATSANTLIVSGNTNVDGNLFVGGNIYASGNMVVTTATIYDMVVTGNVQGNLQVSGTLFSSGSELLSVNTAGPYNLFSGGIVLGNVLFPATYDAVSQTDAAFVVAGGVGVGGNVIAGGFNGPYYGTIINPDQPNITNVGTLGNLTVTYTTTTNRLNVQTIGVTDVTITNNLFIQSGTISGVRTLTATGNIIAANVNAAIIGNVGTTLTGTLNTAAQPGLTSLGNLTALTVSGNITAQNSIAVTNKVTTANLQVTGNTVLGNVFAGNIIPSVGNIFTLGSRTSWWKDIWLNAGTIYLGGTRVGVDETGNLNANISGYVYGTIYGNAVYDNLNRVVSTSSGAGNLTINSVTGNIALTATGPGAVTVGSATAVPIITTDAFGRITNLTSAAVSSTLATTGTTGTGTVSLTGQTLVFAGNFGVTAVAGSQTVTIGTPQDLRSNANPTFSGVFGQIKTNAQPFVTSLGTLTGLTVSGAIVPTSNAAAVNLGSTTAWFNNIYGRSVQALYADLAENYTSDTDYAPGTVVVFGGDAEITVTSIFADPRVAGAISTDPAYLMNGGATGLPVALRGRVPCKVIGPVAKGDLLVTSTVPGFAVSVGHDRSQGASVFAKSIETNLDAGEKVITAVIL
jgi:hypothetical protein